jgi:hypothetical protein
MMKHFINILLVGMFAGLSQCVVAVAAHTQTTPTPAVIITTPLSGSTVSGVISFNCTNLGGTVGLYIDDNFVGYNPYSWNTTTAANGNHYLLCNGYLNSSLIGSASVNVTVSNGVSTPTPGPTPTPIATAATSAAAASIATFSPTPSATPTPNPTPTPSCVNSGQSTIDVVCTGVADSYVLQGAMNCSGSVVRPHGTCDVNTGIMGTNIGFDGTDATLNVEPTVPTGVTLITGPNAYSSKPWKNLRLVGSNNNSTGLLLEGNFTQIENPSISGFTNNITVGNYAYLDTIVTPTIWNGGTGIYCPAGTDSGEGITVVSGEIFNLGTASYNSGCGLTFFGTHFDGIAASVHVLNEGSNGAGTDCTNCYVEEFGTQPSGPIISVTGYNGFGSFNWQGGSIGQDAYSNAAVLSLTNNGTSTSAPYVKFLNTAFKGVGLSGLAANSNVALCGDINLNGGGLIGNVPNSGSCP